MKAVIIAAGEGSRMCNTLGSSSLPKPILPLLGIPIIERIIRASKRAGINDFIVVTGYRGEKIKDYLGDGKRLGVKIRYAFNQQWPMGNAYSLLAARPFIEPEERFFLLMGDHIFEPALLHNFLKHVEERVGKSSLPEKSQKLHFLAVETSFPKELDLDEATKALITGENITGLGKELKQFNGVDTGLFNFHYHIFDILTENIENSNGSISSALQPIISNNNLKAFQFKNLFWQDIDNRTDLEQAKRRLLKRLVPEKDGMVSRYFNRHLSLAITSHLSNFPISPNAISVASFFMCLGSAFLFALGQPVAASLIAQLASVLDGVDGEIARVKFQESPFGAYFDSILDRYADAALIGGIVAGSLLAETSSPLLILLAGFFALTASPFSMLSKEKYTNLTGKEYIPSELEGRFSYLPINRDGRIAIIMVGGLLNQLTLTLIVLAVLTNLQIIIRLIVVRKQLLCTNKNIK
ncbi:MAG: NTP transferase domain-containing protein [Firmicutes bacterium]|nr:NTP transferase domain-containing protein [Bacillota bacterium]